MVDRVGVSIGNLKVRKVIFWLNNYVFSLLQVSMLSILLTAP